MIIASLFLFMALIEAISVILFLAIMDTEKMALSTALLTIGELFVFRIYLNIPAIILLVLGIIILKRK